MKILFVGEGRHDIGPGDGLPRLHRARGVVPALTRKVVGAVDPGSVAVKWTMIPRFAGDRRRRGDREKLLAARLLAARHDCVAVVAVADRDRPENVRRLERMREAQRAGGIPIACGLAVESVEAWTLGDPRAIAEVLDLPVEAVRKRCPKRSVEALNPRSGKQALSPKTVVETVAALGDRHDGLEFREAVAEATDAGRLEEACPLGFAPFAEDQRVTLGPMAQRDDRQG